MSVVGRVRPYEGNFREQLGERDPNEIRKIFALLSYFNELIFSYYKLLLIFNLNTNK